MGRRKWSILLPFFFSFDCTLGGDTTTVLSYLSGGEETERGGCEKEEGEIGKGEMEGRLGRRERKERYLGSEVRGRQEERGKEKHEVRR